MGRQEKKVVRLLLEHFRQSEVDFPTSPEELSTGQRKEKRTPRPHQLEAINNVVEGLGWSIYRIWSTDWIRDPKGKLQRLDAQIKELVRS